MSLGRSHTFPTDDGAGTLHTLTLFKAHSCLLCTPRQLGLPWKNLHRHTSTHLAPNQDAHFTRLYNVKAISLFALKRKGGQVHEHGRGHRSRSFCHCLSSDLISFPTLQIHPWLTNPEPNERILTAGDVSPTELTRFLTGSSHHGTGRPFSYRPAGSLLRPGPSPLQATAGGSWALDHGAAL